MDILLIISIIWFSSEIILSRIKHSGEGTEDHDKFSLRILWISIIMSITLGIFVKNTSFTVLDSDSLFLYFSGIGLILYGLILRWVAILTLKKSFTVNVAVSKAQILVKDGIFRFIRHPAYFGSLCSFLGLGISFNNWLSIIAILIPVLTAFLYRIHIEEKVLLAAFGREYSAYCKKSKRLIPGLF